MTGPQVLMEGIALGEQASHSNASSPTAPCATCPPRSPPPVLFNTVGWGYIHLRASHEWDPAMARRHVIDLALNGLTTPASDGTNRPYDLEINSGRC